MARPSKYSEEIADKICLLISTTSRGLVSICQEIGINPDTVYTWLKDKQGFSDKYARAREDQADLLADEIISIADDNSRDAEAFVGGNHVNRARLQIDARKWKASKLAPKKYGDKMDVTSNGEAISSYVIGFKKPEENKEG